MHKCKKYIMYKYNEIQTGLERSTNGIRDSRVKNVKFHYIILW